MSDFELFLDDLLMGAMVAFVVASVLADHGLVVQVVGGLVAFRLTALVLERLTP